MSVRMGTKTVLILGFITFLASASFIGHSQAATHVNISIEQNPADVKYVDGKAPAELRAGPSSSGRLQQQRSDFGYSPDTDTYHHGNYRYHNHQNFNDGQSSRSAQLRQPSQGAANTQVAGLNSNVGQQQQQQVAYNSQRRQHFQPSRSANLQEKQNQEFERYIQNYHNGPTVETVFESATPSPSQRSSGSSSSTSSVKSERVVAIGSRPTHTVHTFERQVALPTTTATLLPSSDGERQTHTIVNHQPKSVNEVPTSSSSGSSSFDSASASEGGVAGDSGYDQVNFDQAVTTYQKPSHDESGYNNYDNDLQNQFPPVVDESVAAGAAGFGSGGDDHYYGGAGSSNDNDQGNYYGGENVGHGAVVGSTPGPGYLPSYPRPLVTKTIQIAQPALKAKKYEIRHPAIQKEFYDIEERVVIKPAGTIVVELERPVAKIPKGETILPLGHPHPAVASAYNINGHSIVQSVDSGDGVHGNKAGSGTNTQYSPTPAYSPKPVEEQHPVISSTTIASTLTTTPSYDQNSKDEFVEANLNRQYNGETQYVTTTERGYGDEQVTKTNTEFALNGGNNGGGGGTVYVAAVDGSGNQRQIPSRNLSPNMFTRDEPDSRVSVTGRQPTQTPAHVEIRNNGAPAVTRSQTNYQPQQQPVYNVQSRKPYNDNSNQYYGSEFYNGPQFRQQIHQSQNAKPARLQEQPRPVQTQVIKHEHNIVLPASQHNIFLGRLEQAKPQTSQQFQGQRSAQLNNYPRYNEEAAHVLEVKPFNSRQRPQTVRVFASTTVRPLASATGRSGDQARYNQYNYNNNNAYNPSRGNLQYSDSYSNMRYNTPNNKDDQYNSARLTASNNADDNFPNDDKSTSTEHTRQPLHIHIQMPQHHEEANKPIIISSTISPAIQENKQDGRMSDKYRSSTVYNDNDNNYRRGGQHNYDYQRSGNLELNSKPDCDDHHMHSAQLRSRAQQPSFQRLVEGNAANSNAEVLPPSTNLQTANVDLNLQSASGHVPMHGSRVIAATPAPTDASQTSESFHKRRIVVNHPFQTVREVVEHEPITNYHHVQVHEPASPELYTAPYIQTHGALHHHLDQVSVPVYHHQHATHGNLNYAVPVHSAVPFGYHHV